MQRSSLRFTPPPTASKSKKPASEDTFPDVGHKRFNRLWLDSKNPMASAGRCLAEGDEALFSLGILQEGWYLLVNVMTWKPLLLVNAFA
jgi:hypothetical protein